MKVIIIGSGIAGLSAANELLRYGVEVVLLESNSRVGGRICKSDDLSIPIDLGASWIHRVNGNPLADLAKSLNLKMDLSSNPNLTGEASFEIFDSDGQKIDPETEQKVREKFSLLQDRGLDILKNAKADLSVQEMFELASSELGVKNVETPQETRLMNWLKSGIEGWENASLSQLSAKNHFGEADQDIFSGPDGFVVSGFYQVGESLAQNLMQKNMVKLNQAVEKVVYTDTGVAVKTKTDVFLADYCISTLPLGVLKSGSVKFYPPLPERKAQAIESLGFGTMNKIVLEFKECFWNPNAEGFGCASGDYAEFGFFLNLYPLLKKPILMCFVAGDFARKMELMHDDKIVKKIMKNLNKIYGSSHPTQPKAPLEAPVNVSISRWYCNPHSRGSYSFMKVGSSLEDVHHLANPVGNLLFAGEATFVYPGYTHGAYLSGRREAQRILKKIFSAKTPQQPIVSQEPQMQLRAVAKY